MSWVITVVAFGALTVDAQIKAAKQQEFNLEKQAENEKLAAKGAELQRRERLNKVLAQSAVGQAASGIGIEGTPQSIALSTAKKASLSEGLESLSDRLRQAQLKREAQAARRSGGVAAASTLLSTGMQAGALAGTTPKGATK